MPSVALKLYSVFFKLFLKHKLQSLHAQAAADDFGVTSRPDESSAAPANPSFGPDGVATKDIHVDPFSSLSLRLFLPDSSLAPRNSHHAAAASPDNAGNYGGYLPSAESRHRPAGSRKLPVILQFHGGAFVTGSNTSPANDFFCRRIAKLLDVIVVAVGYRLAPESRYPAAFEDGFKVLNWLGKQANLAECSKSLGSERGGGGGGDLRRSQIADAFGASTVEPWLAAHGDPSRCVLLGVSSGANIADSVARKAVEAGKLIEPVKVVAQVLMYPFFTGSVPTHSEIKLANSYFYDKSLCLLAWKLFLPKEEFSLDHPAANPLVSNRAPPLRLMPPTMTVVAEHDWMKDRAIAYAEELRKVNVDAPVLEYKDAVHEFATLDMLLKTPQAQACAEDIAIWVKKYISIRGHEFSY
ncbi:putative carboxylesterase 16 [Canna indica]|uniref:Carboxylesterase 16 n=1 Tax=Canna indica TaxID=4628 RepID=A0AAQ3QRH4_9LILI|nr:putative carboxylesterase 16 [Canna indica]